MNVIIFPFSLLLFVSALPSVPLALIIRLTSCWRVPFAFLAATSLRSISISSSQQSLHRYRERERADIRPDPEIRSDPHPHPHPHPMASKLVLVTVFIFDLIAFALAVAAEQRRTTASMESDREKNYTYCVYGSDVATGYGVGALLFLLASQALVTASTRCFCCGRSLRPGGSRACAAVLFFLSWLTFLIAEACLLAGSVRNAYHTRYRAFFGDELTCQTLRKGVFGAGAAFVFLTALVSEIYCVSYSKARGDGVPPYADGEAGVRMAPYH